MIVKDLEPLHTADPLRRAGHEAERQMAFYLRRAYADDPTVRVWHGLRLERQGEVAQIDHLILHRHGAVIVESKSVSGEVRVNAQGEWARVWGGRRTGMPSPVLQAGRQMDLLRQQIRDHAADLLDRLALGRVQKNIGAMARDELVAVSDGGLIRRDLPLPQVMKADQIVPHIQAQLTHYRRAAGPLSLNFRDGHHGLSDGELVRLTAFLTAKHTPQEGQGEPPATIEPRPGTPPEQRAQVKPHASVPTCRQCQGQALEILHGRYGYYFKCRACAGHTPAKANCCTCGQPARLHKDGPRFHAECPAGHRALYFQNP